MQKPKMKGPSTKMIGGDIGAKRGAACDSHKGFKGGGKIVKASSHFKGAGDLMAKM